MMAAGGAFQAAVAAALLDPEAAAAGPPAARRLIADPAFAIYRNTVLGALVDALAANFPAVARLTGAEWFRAAASVHARAAPPRHPALMSYGAEFPAFLADFPPAHGLPYLPVVAMLDRLWTQAHVAADAPALAASALAGMDPARLSATVLRLHPAAHFVWAPHSAPSIWLEQRGFLPAADRLLFEPRGEGVLVTRPRDAVRAMRTGPGDHALLAAVADGASLGEAAAAALAAEPELDLVARIGAIVAAGAFVDHAATGANKEPFR